MFCVAFVISNPPNTRTLILAAVTGTRDSELRADLCFLTVLETRCSVLKVPDESSGRSCVWPVSMICRWCLLVVSSQLLCPLVRALIPSQWPIYGCSHTGVGFPYAVHGPFLSPAYPVMPHTGGILTWCDSTWSPQHHAASVPPQCYIPDLIRSGENRQIQIPQCFAR